MSTYSNTVLADAPVAYYRLDESSGTTATDSSGNGNNATYSGSGITYSQVGALSGDSDTAVLLDGANGKISCPSGASVVGYSQITLEAWVKLSSNSFSHLATIWATGTTPTNSGDGIKFWVGQNGTNGGFAVGLSGSKWAQATFSQTFTAGTWYHVVGTWDGTTIQLYVNGVTNGTNGIVTGNTIDSTGHNPEIGQDPQSGVDYFPGDLDEPALYSKALSGGRINAHYAAGIATLPAAPALITNAPGNVLLLINDVYYPTIRQETIHVERTASDPIPTFTFDLQDDPSHIPISELLEIVFIDAGQIANPTHNLLTNAILNPYNTNWTATGGGGVTIAQNTGGGVQFTFSNAANGGNFTLAQTTATGGLVSGQSYMASVQIQGSSLVAVQGWLEIDMYDVNSTLLASYKSAIYTDTTLTQLTVSFTASATASYVNILLYTHTTSATNSGTATFTQSQLEPMCFTYGNYQIPYPTPWAASGQTNCTVLPDGTTVRQLRLFGGYVTKATAGVYIGLNRRWTVTASGYAWLLQKLQLNTSWTGLADSAIISNIVTTYFATTFSTAQVVTGQTFNGTLQYAYNGTARDAFDALAANANYPYYIDAYRTIWYQPAGYNTLSFALSDRPDMITSFPYYNYSRDIDGTQLGNVTYVSGATNIAAVEYDAQSIAIYNQKSGRQGQFWRTVSDSAIQSVGDAQLRAIGETAQYNYARPIVHLDTTQFMIPGYSVLLTSATDSLNQVPFLVQKATLILKGFNQPFAATYECNCDLGYFNPDMTNIHAKILRRQVANNTSIPTNAYYGPVTASTPAIGVMATESTHYLDSVLPSITQSTSVGGIPGTQYGAASAVYGSNLVGYS